MQIFLKFIDVYWKQLTAGLWLGITLMSLTPLPELPLPGTDKTHHLLAYACLMAPVAVHKPRGWQYLAFGFIAWSGVIELIQPFVNRHGEWLDLLANSAGVLTAVLLIEVVRWLQNALQGKHR